MAGCRLTVAAEYAHPAVAGPPQSSPAPPWPHPIDLDRRLALRGARRAAGPLARAHTRARSTRPARRRRRVVMVAPQRLRIGRAHAGKTITVIAEDTSFRVLDGEHELTSFARDPASP